MVLSNSMTPLSSLSNWSTQNEEERELINTEHCTTYTVPMGESGKVIDQWDWVRGR